MVEQKLPTLQQIKKAIPERCFKVRTDAYIHARTSRFMCTS